MPTYDMTAIEPVAFWNRALSFEPRAFFFSLEHTLTEPVDEYVGFFPAMRLINELWYAALINGITGNLEGAILKNTILDNIEWKN